MISIVGDAFGASFAPSMVATRHVQHGVAVLIGLETDVVVNGTRSRVAVVPADVAHDYTSEGPTLGLLLDPEVYLPTIRPHAVEVVRAHRASLERRDVLEGLVRELALRGRIPRDVRVERVRAALSDPSLGTDEVLRIARLSEPHLQALFARDVGISMRTYRLWQRLLIAVLLLREVDATCAAHRAGFADLAHFSRTCRRMMGLSPSQMRAALAHRGSFPL